MNILVTIKIRIKHSHISQTIMCGEVVSALTLEPVVWGSNVDDYKIFFRFCICNVFDSFVAILF